MYELLVLGALLTVDMSGYKLRTILENNLVPRRPLSNGTLYPCLHSMEKDGYITMLAVNDKHGSKLAHITPAGIARYHELMAAPIPADSKRESMYRFKFRSLGATPLATQRTILTDYRDVVQSELNIYLDVHAHVTGLTPAMSPEQFQVANSSLRTLELQIAINRTKLEWVAKQLANLPTAPKQ